MKYLICGKGTVGEAWGEALKSWDHEVEYYDPPKDLKPAAKEFDGVFICAPTPTKEFLPPSQDYSAVQECLEYCEEEIKTNWVSIRSTVLPEILTGLKSDYDLKLFSHPEFLRERYAKKEAKNPKLIVIGSDDLNKVGDYYNKIYPEEIKNKAEAVFYESQEEAIFFKYAANIMFSMKIIYANTMREMFEEIPTGGECHLRGMLNRLDEIFAGRHMDPYQGEEFGFGGKCLPKDTKLWYDQGYELIDAVMKQNWRYRNEKIS